MRGNASAHTTYVAIAPPTKQNRSYVDGSIQRLTPELSIKTQRGMCLSFVFSSICVRKCVRMHASAPPHPKLTHAIPPPPTKRQRNRARRRHHPHARRVHALPRRQVLHGGEHGAVPPVGASVVGRVHPWGRRDAGMRVCCCSSCCVLVVPERTYRPTTHTHTKPIATPRACTGSSRAGCTRTCGGAPPPSSTTTPSSARPSAGALGRTSG